MKKIFYSFIFLMLAFGLGGCQLETSYNSRLSLAIAVISIITILFLALAFNSNLLREEVSDQDAFAANAKQQQAAKKWKLPNSKAPFSLTKVQFGIWTVIISSAYIYLSLCKGDCATGSINQTALVLMGIFAGTAVASTIIDKNEISDNRARLQNRPSQGFFVDILSDSNGISLHRFQNFAWTVIAMVVYLYKLSEITTGCQLPELSDTLLALTGISSATYLVMKTKENDPPAQTAAASGTEQS
ncbi:MAG: hypothetical protein J0I32_04890 [Sphingobacteriales bacterium]|nr:hypothetical protein [Sphingobacteriales bacterium]OJV98497.1 MAG: hypothetical protein BGO52_11980 [Sphingobacteriales bacterium 44-61]